MTQPLILYGAKISYYTGKMGSLSALQRDSFPVRLAEQTNLLENPEEDGHSQMPAIELADGRMMTDTTPMIDWLEEAYPEHRNTV